MPYYVRAINRENWPEPEDQASVHDLCADALNDLKTDENYLSFWFAEDEARLYKAELAYLASMDKWVNMEEVEFIAIDVEDVDKKKYDVKPNPNFTYIKEYETRHRDFCDLNYDTIEKIAEIIIKSIGKNQEKVVTTTEIRSLFKSAVEDGLIKSDDIDKGHHGKLRKYIKEIESKQ